MAESKVALVIGAGEATGGETTACVYDSFPERYALKDKAGILDPEAIAENYWQLHRQARSAWTHELDLRPWMEPW